MQSRTKAEGLKRRGMLAGGDTSAVASNHVERKGGIQYSGSFRSSSRQIAASFSHSLPNVKHTHTSRLPWAAVHPRPASARPLQSARLPPKTESWDADDDMSASTKPDSRVRLRTDREASQKDGQARVQAKLLDWFLARGRSRRDGPRGSW